MTPWTNSFEAWASARIAEAQRDYPSIPPYDLSRYDGCSMVPDVSREACFLHDRAYHYLRYGVGDRAKADAALRAAIAAAGETDELAYRWAWRGVAWTYWAGVRVFGRKFVKPLRDKPNVQAQAAFGL